MMIRIRFLLCLALLLAWAPLSTAFAQQPVASAEEQNQSSAQRLDTLRAQLQQMEASLQRRDQADEALQAMRGALEPINDGLREAIDELTPRFETLKQRLDQLGPKPDAKAVPESPDIAKDRESREKDLRGADEALRLARTLQLQAEQIATTIADRRRAIFARALFERQPGLISPWLWSNLLVVLPRDIRAFEIVFGDWISSLSWRADWRNIMLLIGACMVAFLLLRPAKRVARDFAPRDRLEEAPSSWRRISRALYHGAVGAALPALAAWVVYLALSSGNLLPGRIEPIAAALLQSIAIWAVMRSLMRAYFAPHLPQWRLANVDDQTAARLVATASRAIVVTATGKVIEAVNQAIGAGLSLTVATRGTFALVFALVVWNGLRRLKPAVAQEEACLGPYVASVRDLTGPIRLALMIALGIVVASVLTGYVALGAFLNDQIIWIVIVAIVLGMVLMLIEQVFGAGLAPDARMTRSLMENVGLRQRSVEQLGVVLGGLGRLAAIIVAGLMVAAPWGVESRDLLSSLKAIFFGFKVGDVTISLSSVVLAVGLFALGILATRAIQRWLSDAFLPKTDLDAGLRNSIRTAFGYIGVIVATAVAFSSLGLSLDKLTIVAGALSLGIGFGLQSIVNNFVSGLILLWERPVRVGDWIVVGDDQGIVRRINVRSTEIMTFDRSTVIMPNSNLISGVVKNRVHSDRTGRVLLPISVPRASDPEHVASILEKAALAHREVMSEPAPKVFFKRINEASLDFELVCFVADVDVMGAVSSELHFAVFKALASGGVGAPRPHVEIEGLERIEDALEDIADAIEEDQEERIAKAKGKAATLKPEKPREAAKTAPGAGAKRSGKDA